MVPMHGLLAACSSACWVPVSGVRASSGYVPGCPSPGASNVFVLLTLSIAVADWGSLGPDLISVIT